MIDLVEQGFLTEVLIPASLVIIMVGMGLGLDRRDFTRLLETPVSVTAGLAAQLVAVPLVAVGVTWLIPTRPVLAMGILIISFCPGGAVSNLVSHLARGNVALSVTLTAISSMVTVLTIPVLVNLALGRLMTTSVAIRMPILPTAFKLALVTILPVIVGMAIRRRAPAFAARSERAVRIGSGAFLALVIVAAVAPRIGELPRYLREVGLQLVVFNMLAMAIGWVAGSVASLDTRDRMTIAIEAGIQNGALGIAIPATLIGNPEMAVPPAIYGVLMIVTSIGFVIRGGGSSHRAESARVGSRDESA